MSWDDRWMGLARHVSGWSKDRSRQVGCVIVDPRQVLVSIGWNGFPRGVNDNVDARHHRPAKYQWTEHAERNAIANAAAKGVSTLGCTIYLPWYPCADCARMIVQAGIGQMVCVEPDWNDPQYGSDFKMVREMLLETATLVRFVAGEAPKQRDPAAAKPAEANSALAMNVGHGHIFPRPDGYTAPCGGSGMCRSCQNDAQLKRQGLGAPR